MKSSTNEPPSSKIRPSDFVSDSKLLSFFLSRETSPLQRTLAFTAIFLTIPGALLAYSAFDHTLRFEDKGDGAATGLLQDFLFLCFAFAIAPLLLFSLMFIIRRFKFFLDEIRVHTNLDEKGKLETQEATLKLVTDRGRGNWVMFAKCAIGGGALYSNMSSIISRTDGWNAPSHPVQFTLTLLYLTILFFFVINDIFVKYLRILWAEIRTTRRLAKRGMITVRPLAPDKAGGLRNLGDLSLAFTYFLLPLAAAPLTHYYTWPETTAGNTLFIIAFIPLFVIVFFVPLGVVHRVMADTKRKTLHGICEKYLEVNRLVTSKLESGADYADVAPHREMLDMLDGMYERADRMPVWPFNLNMLTRFLSITLSPLVIVLAESTIQFVMELVLK